MSFKEIKSTNMFPIMTGNPFIQGFAQGQGIKSNRLGIQEQQERLKTLPELLAAQLELQQQKAAQAGIQTEYMPQDLQSEIALRQAHIPLLGAQTAHLNQETSMMPFGQMLEAQRAYNQAQQIQQSMNRFGNAYQVSRFMQTPEGQQLIKNNDQVAGAVNRIMAGTADAADEEVVNKASGGTASGGNNTLLPAFQELLQQKYNLGAPNEPPNNQPLLTRGQVDKMYGLDERQMRDTQNVAGSDVIKKTVPTLVQQQRYYDKSLENMFEKLDSKIERAAKFSGIMGQAELKTNQAKTALGIKPSDDYKNYLQTQQLLHGVANELGRSLGNHATNQQIHMLQEISNPISWRENPETTMIKYHALQDMARANAAAISKTGQDINWDIQNTTGNSSGMGAASQNTPNFTSRDQAKSWYLQNKGGR